MEKILFEHRDWLPDKECVRTELCQECVGLGKSQDFDICKDGCVGGKPVHMKVSIIVKWYDMWVGIFVDKKKRTIYILPFPCIGFLFKWR